MLLILPLIIWSNLIFSQNISFNNSESVDINDSTEFYVLSEVDNLYRIYYGNGNLWQVGSFEVRRTKIFKLVHRRVGLWKTFYEEGGLKEKGIYVDDKKDFIWEYYTKEGDLLKVQSYNKGIMRDQRIYLEPSQL